MDRSVCVYVCVCARVCVNCFAPFYRCCDSIDGWLSTGQSVLCCKEVNVCTVWFAILLELKGKEIFPKFIFPFVVVREGGGGGGGGGETEPRWLTWCQKNRVK